MQRRRAPLPCRTREDDPRGRRGADWSRPTAARQSGRPLSALLLTNGHAELLEACIGHPISHTMRCYQYTPNINLSSK
jgi:hypothetical protein